MSIKNVKSKIKNYLLLFVAYYFSLFAVVYAAGFELGVVRPKIITPNADNKNDMLIVPYDNPNDSNISGKILTINGSYIADMLVNDSDPYNPKITWDGKEDGGNAVPSGIYIYQIETEGQVFNGTVVVAK